MTPSEKLVELLPCPFCGNPDVEYDIICIECHNCGASGGPRRAIGEDGVLTSEELWNKRRWNTRASIPTPEASEQIQDMGDCAARTVATHEPSPSSTGLGPSGECQLSRECPTCQGRGEVWVFPNGLSRAPDPAQCDDCHGTGAMRP
jgi:hypothetical protein